MRFNIHWSLKELADLSKQRIENRFDANIIVTGGTGVGKSSFLWKFFHKFNDFKVEDKLTYSREETIKLIRDYKKSYCWNDEMISSGNKRKFYEVEQIELIEVLTKYRCNYNIFAGAVPVFFTLDKELLKLFGMHINLVSRGIAVLHLPKEGRMFSDDPWDVKINAKLEEKWSKLRQKNPDFKIPYHKYTTFAGYIFFNPMTKKQEDYYEYLRDKKKGLLGKENEENSKDSKPDFYEKILEMLLEKKLDDVELQKMCVLNGKKYSNVKTHLNQLLKDKGKTETLTFFLAKRKNLEKLENLHINKNISKSINIDL